jgi:hypothetical protein
VSYYPITSRLDQSSLYIHQDVKLVVRLSRAHQHPVNVNVYGIRRSSATSTNAPRGNQLTNSVRYEPATGHNNEIIL